MEFKEVELKGVFEVQLKPIKDTRGFFMRTYDNKIFEKHGIKKKWVQENHSRSEKKGIIRGLHLQLPPYAETKLVRCIRGGVQDVFVDLRKNSLTFGKWGSIELSESNRKMVLIPRGFAHGFCTMTEESEVLYKVDNFYNREMERGIAWDDPDLNINWNTNEPVLSEKDQANQLFKEFVSQTGGIDIIEQ